MTSLRLMAGSTDGKKNLTWSKVRPIHQLLIVGHKRNSLKCIFFPHPVYCDHNRRGPIQKLISMHYRYPPGYPVFCDFSDPWGIPNHFDSTIQTMAAPRCGESFRIGYRAKKWSLRRDPILKFFRSPQLDSKVSLLIRPHYGNYLLLRMLHSSTPSLS